MRLLWRDDTIHGDLGKKIEKVPHILSHTMFTNQNIFEKNRSVENDLIRFYCRTFIFEAIENINYFLYNFGNFLNQLIILAQLDKWEECKNEKNCWVFFFHSTDKLFASPVSFTTHADLAACGSFNPTWSNDANLHGRMQRLLHGWIQRGSHNPINDAQVTGVHDSRCLQLPSHLNIAWCFNCSCGVVSVPLLPLSIYVMCQLFYNKSCASVTSVIVGRTVVGVREMQTLITCSCIVLNACIYIHASLSLEASFCFLKR